MVGGKGRLIFLYSVDTAVDLLEAFRALDSGILDVQAEVDTLEAEMAEDEDGQKA